MHNPILEDDPADRINLDALHVRAIGDMLQKLSESIPSGSQETIDLEANTVSQIGFELFEIGKRIRDDLQQILDGYKAKEGQGHGD